MMAPLDSLSRSVKRFLPASVKTQMRLLMGQTSTPARLRQWVIRPDSSPWFDRPDALEALAIRRRNKTLSDADYQRLHQWVTNGHFAVPGLISHRLIDSMMRDLDSLWTIDKSHEGLDIDDLRVGPKVPCARLSHGEVCAMAPSVRAAARDRSNWRIHGFPRFSDSAKLIFANPELRRLASLILGRPADPRYSINFMYGSTQTEHQDTVVHHIFPPNYLAGAWIACEDILPDSGPLMYYPRSHREPLFHAFGNYPQTNLKTAPAEVMQQYHEYAVSLARKYERHLFIAKKGDVLFWHGMMLHGGSEVKNPKLTRRSFVIHYVPPGMDVSDQVVGPFNW